MDATEIAVVTGGCALIAFVIWYFFGEREQVAAGALALVRAYASTRMCAVQIRTPAGGAAQVVIATLCRRLLG